MPPVTEILALDGESHTLILDGNNSFRILTLSGEGTLELNHLTLRNGYADTSLGYGMSGAAVYNDGFNLIVRNSTFSHNTADENGGAIFSSGDLTISNSTFSNNAAGEIAGGVAGLYSLVVKNSTFSGNAAPGGAGLQSGGPLTLDNSILANSVGPDCGSNTIASAQNNLIESTGTSACGLVNGMNGNKVGVDPKLSALANNGGSTQTFALQSGSPAIDAGNNSICSAAPVNNKDQRNFTRPLDGDGNGSANCDIGSYEAATPNTPTATHTRTNTPTQTHTPTQTRTITPTVTATPTTGCIAKPGKPTLLKPKDNKTITKPRVKLDWSDALCATS